MLAEFLNLPISQQIPVILANTASRGISIAITGMLIVACALILICLFIGSLPKVLAAVATVWPETVEPHGAKTHPESLVADDDSVLAAIGFVLHHRLQQQNAASNSPTKTT